MQPDLIRHFPTIYFTFCRGGFAIIHFAMQVYVELAVLENFCMDFTLLYCAKLTVKNTASRKRVGVAAALGACFAVAFPLFGLNGAWAAVVKIISGLLICLCAGKFGSVKGYIKFTGTFLLYSAVLAGALYGIFSLAGIEYAEGGGYILSSVPVGIPLFGALCLVGAARALKNKFTKAEKSTVTCNIFLGGNKISLPAFFDSGNKVSFRGEPVSVIPQSFAKKLIDTEGIKDEVKIHTVAGSKKIKVFTADRLEIDYGKKFSTLYGVKIGVSYAHINCAVLHPDISEE